MTYLLIGIALKSLLISGLTFGLLQLVGRRSAAERSWVAHIGLLALVIVALAPVALPSWNIQTPSIEQILSPAAVEGTASEASARNTAAPALVSVKSVEISLYAIPVGILLSITLLSIGRLITLRARAEVLVDGPWLSALARAQRRMGFKHGTALLTSNELASPISWGLMRPVILLNSRAVEASSEAEAIIAHELAHVARLDWAKLLLARVATALFWFNPLVWMLAREAHQLREEAADDAVLATSIPHTDYAELLVQVARHECRGLLLGAHGVAPSKDSLARRIARILDGKAARGPVARNFSAAVFAGATLVIAPLASLTLTPATAAENAAAVQEAAVTPAKLAAHHTTSKIAPRKQPHTVDRGNAKAGDQAAATKDWVSEYFRATSGDVSATPPPGTIVSRAPNGATTILYPPDSNGRRKEVSFSPNGAMTTSYPPDASGLRKVVSRAPNGAITTTYMEDKPQH